MNPPFHDEAAAALAAAREEPTQALQRAKKVIEESDTVEVLAIAHFACGLAHRSLADVTTSTTHLEQARDYASEDNELRGQILRSLAFNYGQAGRNALADATVAKSIALLTGQEQELSRLQQAFMLMMRGDHLAALPVLTNAIQAFRESNDEEYLELTLRNRALIHLELGDYDASVADLEETYEIATKLEHPVAAADAAGHLSQVLGWRDDIPGAMEWHARSVRLLDDADAANPVATTEHALVLVQAQLMREAEQVLTEGIPRLYAAGDMGVAVPAHLQLADVLLARGAHDKARLEVDQAREVTPANGRFRFDVAAATHRVQIASGDFTRDLLDSMLATGAEMAANGEKHAAALENFGAVDVALAIGDLTTAAALCDDAVSIVRSGPLWVQIEAWTALAKVRLALGNRRGAAAAVRAGTRRLDEYRSGIGAVDLRIRASQLGSQLAGIGIELALESGSISRVFEWSERLRTSAMAIRREPTHDPEMDSALASLRRATTRLRTAGPETIEDLRREAASCERQVRQLARQARASRGSFATRTLIEAQSHLSDRTLVEFVEAPGRIGAIVATSDASRWIDLGPSPQTREVVDHLRFAAERIARPSTSAASRTAALDSVDQLVAQIREQLIDPLDIDTDRAVVVPCAVLHGVPWGLVLDIPVEVAPSATVWLASRTATPSSPRTLIVHGPGLEHATAEANEIKAIAGGAVASTVTETLEMLSGVTLAHFACHARPRLDSPMFSSLVLDDGELTLYDIERLPRVPSTVVLAACDGGSAVMASGDEVLGLANAFLSLGATTVVAPLFTVSDEATASVMRSVHHSLAAGTDAAAALLAARQSPDELVSFTAGSFACFGA